MGRANVAQSAKIRGLKCDTTDAEEFLNWVNIFTGITGLTVSQLIEYSGLEEKDLKPLMEYSHQTVESWSDEMQDAFQDLKEAFELDTESDEEGSN